MIYQGKCEKVLPQLKDELYHAIVTDPPYGLGREPTPEEIDKYLAAENALSLGDFMGKDWDIPSVGVWKQCYRVLKPGCLLLSFGGTRTLDLIDLGIQAAGFTKLNTILWIHCLTEDAEILTDEGWVPIDASMTGRQVLCYDVDRGSFAWHSPLGQYLYPYDGRVYRLQGDHTNHVVTPEHRCLVADRGGNLVFKRARDLGPEERCPSVENLPELLESLPLEREGRESESLLPRMWEGPFEAASAAQSAFGAPGYGALSLSRVRQGFLSTSSMDSESQAFMLLEVVCQQGARTGIEGACSQGQCSSYAGGYCELASCNDRPQQPCLEGWRDILFTPRVVRLDEVCALPARVSNDGEKGRLRRRASSSRGASVRSSLASFGSGASCGPQPEEQPAGKPDALRLESGSQTLRASRFTHTDLVRVTTERYRGLVGCITTPTGTFVARQNGKVFITGNSQGFPKGGDVSKKIDKKKGAKPIVVGPDPEAKRRNKKKPRFNGDQYANGDVYQGATEVPLTEPGSEAGQLWRGWGSQLKPSWEPVMVYSKGDPIRPVDFTDPFFYCAKAVKSETTLKGTIDNSHPTKKPIKLMTYLVSLAAKPGELILDPYFGSGSTGVACIEQDIQCDGIEMDDGFFEIASNRCRIVYGERQSFKGQQAVFSEVIDLFEDDEPITP